MGRVRIYYILFIAYCYMLYYIEILFLSAELVYYNICIPMIFSQKNNVFINTKALITYSVIIFLHAVLILFSYTYYKNSADFHIYCKMMGCWKKINPPESVKLYS